MGNHPSATTLKNGHRGFAPAGSAYAANAHREAIGIRGGVRVAFWAMSFPSIKFPAVLLRGQDGEMVGANTGLIVTDMINDVAGRDRANKQLEREPVSLESFIITANLPISRVHNAALPEPTVRTLFNLTEKECLGVLDIHTPSIPQKRQLCFENGYVASCPFSLSFLVPVDRTDRQSRSVRTGCPFSIGGQIRERSRDGGPRVLPDNESRPVL